MSRRQRRADAASSKSTSDRLSSASEIPLTRPPSTAKSSTSRPTKSLYEIAAERQAELLPQDEAFPTQLPDATEIITFAPDGNLSHTPLPHRTPRQTPAAVNSTLPPLLDTLLLSLPLSSLHFTLTFLTYHQYSQRDTISLTTLCRQTLLSALPVLTLLVHASHGHLMPGRVRNSNRSRNFHAAVRAAQQTVFVITANVAGCYLIHLTNDRGYFAVMKRAPAIGTLWVWCVVELGLLGALLAVIGPALFACWNGYGVF